MRTFKIMGPTNGLLTVTDLAIQIGEKQVLKPLSFTLNTGETLAIVGESGSGKTMTTLGLMGLQPDNARMSGAMYFEGQELNGKSLLPLRGKEVGMIFQEPMSALNPIMPVGKQISECIQHHQKISKSEAHQKTLHWLQQMELPDPESIAGKYPHQLSGGQKQRVMIAMAMCNNPKLLIADEPTTALDSLVQAEIISLLLRLQKQQGMAMLFITHDLNLAAKIANQILVLQQGQTMDFGPVNEVLNTPKSPYTKALLACRPSKDKRGAILPVLGDALVGAVNKPALIRAKEVSDQSLLSVESLCVSFPYKRNVWGGASVFLKAVNDVSFELKKGETLGIIGQSGSGKTTIGRALAGLNHFESGKVYWMGQEVDYQHPQSLNQLRKQVQMIFQDPFASLNPRLTIGQQILEPLAVHHLLPKADRVKRVMKLLDQVHLPADAYHKYPHQFSGGQRQRISIARALAMSPQVLICDESVSALDPGIQAVILNLLVELQQTLGLSYLFITHDLNVANYLCDRIMVMHQGTCVDTFATSELSQPDRDPYTQKLMAAADL